jgi:hypothetical protein
VTPELDPLLLPELDPLELPLLPPEVPDELPELELVDELPELLLDEPLPLEEPELDPLEELLGVLPSSGPGTLPVPP